MAVNNAVSSGVYVFLDQLVFAVAGWIFWFIISKYTSTFDIGQSTAVYSLILLLSTFTQLGFEYPLLNRSFSQKSQILVSVLFIELVITLSAIPIIVLLLNNIYPETARVFTPISIGILLLMALGFVTRYVLLGMSQVKKILIIDVVGNIIKFVTGLTLVSMALGAGGILFAFLMQNVVIGFVTLFISINTCGLKLGNTKYLATVFRDGLVNAPSKLSSVLMFSLCVVLLATFGVGASEIGTFYIALMITFIGSSFASSVALMVIPSSSMSKIDLSSASTRLGVSLTAPLITAFTVAPELILSIIGTEYRSAATILVVLSIGILPFCIMINAISKFNYLGDSRKLILIGSTQLGTFIIAFVFMVPLLGTLGAAYSILIAFTASCIPSLIWSQKNLIRYILNVIIAIIAGWFLGHIAGMMAGEIVPKDILAIVISTSVTFIVILKLGNTSMNEIIQLLKTIINKN